MGSAFADGSWLSERRIRAVALLCGAATLLSLAWLFATAHGTLDDWGRPLGTDFSDVWAAGRMALDGHAADAWNWRLHYAAQQSAHGSADVPFYGWHYPPPFLLVAALLATLPYTAALVVWEGATLGAAALALRGIVGGRRALLVGLCAPVVLVCLMHGQNGFLTAALMAGGLLLIERRPFAAGLLLGCLVYKPQFAVVVGPLLLARGEWRAVAGAACSAAALVALTFALWGWGVWQAFFDSLPLTRHVVIEAGATGWAKIQSPFGWARMWGAGLGSAYAVQAAATLAAVAAVVWLTRTAAPSVRNAAAAAAALLSTPYLLDYDLVLLGLGAAFLVRDGLDRGFLPFEKSLVALVWIAPLCARQAGALAGLPLGQLTVIALFVLAIRRACVLDGAAAALLRASPFRRSHEASAR